MKKYEDGVSVEDEKDVEKFKGYLWNRIPRKDRLLLGTLFLNWIQQNSNIAKPINKTSSGQQKYQKI